MESTNTDEQITEVTDTPDDRHSKTPLAQPWTDGISALYQRVLERHQERVVTSSLMSDTISIKHGRPEQSLTVQPPSYFYRTAHETSATLSRYTSHHSHIKRRGHEEELCSGNAFQSIGKHYIAQHLTREGIERHLKMHQKEPPSTYISAFNRLDHARRRGKFFYKISKSVGHRIIVAKIATVGLIPATLTANCTTTVEILDERNELLERNSEEETIVHRVDIPIWIRKDDVHHDWTDIKVEQLMETNTEVWMSITELRNSNLDSDTRTYVRCPGTECSKKKCDKERHTLPNYIFSKGHDYEWLACGKILEKWVTKVMPYDGEDVHLKRAKEPVRMSDATGSWVFDWKQKMWVMEQRELQDTVERLRKTLRKARAQIKKKDELLRKHGITHEEARDNMDEGAEIEDEESHTAKKPRLGGSDTA